MFVVKHLKHFVFGCKRAHDVFNRQIPPNLVNCEGEQTNLSITVTVCCHNETLSRLFFVGIALHCRGHQPGRFWTFAWVFGHNGQNDSAKAALKLKARLVCAAKGQNLDFWTSVPFQYLLRLYMA